MKKNCIMLLSVLTACCVLSACGKKDAGSSSRPEGSESQYSTAAMQTHKKTLSGISTEIPAEACMKVSHAYVDDEGKPLTSTNIEYRNANDDPLLEYDISESDGSMSGIKCYEYEYNGKGQKLWSCEYSDIIGGLRVSEMFYQYKEGFDEPIAQEHYEDGRPTFMMEHIYDEYGNYLGCYTEYYDRTDETLGRKEIIYKVREAETECEYDENGKLLKSCMYNSKGEKKSVTTYSYDDRGNRITEDVMYNTEVQTPYYHILKKSRYDDRGNAVFAENTYWSDADTVGKKATYEREYDSENRLVRVNITYLEGDTEISVYSYEPL